MVNNLIDRQAVNDIIYHEIGDLDKVRKVKAKVDALPSVQPSRKGHWIEVAQYSDGKHKIECSECGNYIFDRGHANSHNVKEKYKYCNYCGAKMDMRGVE